VFLSYQAALEITPDYLPARHGVASLLLRSGKQDERVVAWLRQIALSDDPVWSLGRATTWPSSARHEGYRGARSVPGGEQMQTTMQTPASRDVTIYCLYS
jgi:hypothetical protein